jgi:Ca2+-binding RTX toxin-like protein
MATITGTSGADILNGTASADTISGLGGNDTLNGKAGNDTIKGGAGLDKIWGDLGNDTLYGDAGDDQMWGGDGNDVMYGGIGNDVMYGDAGTDTLKGEAGNDILKGGTGLSYLYGGDGNDQLFYDPTTSNLKAIGNYLSTSILNGDAGTDTLNLYNKATYTDGTVSKAAHTSISYDDDKGLIRFDTNDYSTSIDVGSFKGVEKLVVNGNGGLTFDSWNAKSPIEVTGTEVADTFYSGPGNDTFIGRGGNDTFYVGGGTDTIISGSNDADIFYFGGWGVGTTTVTGFNNPGVHAGDKIYVNEYYLSNSKTQVVESGGKTTFTTDYGEKLVITTTGLVEGVDWFFA